MSSSPPPVVADRYRLVAPLGQGGMGRVWRATDVVLHREVAIKELVPPPGLTAGERQEMRERSLREARAIARLNNINVVRVFDVLRTDADPWIVMEYVPSRSLQDILAADGPFPPARAAEIGLGVLGALRAAHRAGVVHRDVKPGNVLLGEDGRVVLTDFGLATVPGDPNVTRTGLVLGSPAYIAPERARDGTAGPGSDLWGLGATLYAAVEGASPFARPSAIATLAALATENPPPAKNAGPLKPVLNGLLRKDPTHRIDIDEAERLLLRAIGRRSRMGFSMGAGIRRPGAGRERPPAPPVFPGPAVSGSAPVVPGPRPPVNSPRPQTGPSAGRPPVFAPGKASVGKVPRPVDAPPRVDASNAAPETRVDMPPTRLDTPPVQTQAAGVPRDEPAPPASGVDGDSGASTTVGAEPQTDDSAAAAVGEGAVAAAAAGEGAVGEGAVGEAATETRAEAGGAGGVASAAAAMESPTPAGTLADRAGPASAGARSADDPTGDKVDAEAAAAAPAGSDAGSPATERQAAEAVGAAAERPEVAHTEVSAGRPGAGGSRAGGSYPTPMGSARPPWQPMPVRLPASGGAGVAVLGRRLDWRALVLLVVFVVVLAVAVPLILQDSRQPRGKGSVAPPTAAAQPTPRTSPAVTPSSSAPNSATASPSTPPSSAAPSQPAEFKVPNGWHMHHDDSGFSVPVPDGWSVSRRGSERWFRENGGRYRLLIIDQTSSPKADPVADWRAQERVRRSSYRDYQLIGIRPASYWRAAADWEFLNTSDRGNRLHVLKRGFVTSDNQAYGIHWSTSADDWDANLDALNIIFSGFRPAAHD